MTNSPADARSSNVCYRHPDRQSFVLCQRCGRTICPQCQTQAAVGVHCPECVKLAHSSAPRRSSTIGNALRSSTDRPIATWTIIALCAIIYVLQEIPGSPVTNAMLYYPPLTATEPWRMITSAFVHSPGQLAHIVLNMFSLFLFGPIMERMLGRTRFVVLYLLSGLGGSVGVLLLAPQTPVLGASGAIFGLLGGFFVIQRRLGGNTTQLLVVIGLNLVVGFLPGTNIAWQAHLGGLLVGAAVAFVYLRTRQRSQRTTQLLAVAGVFVALVIITVGRLILG